MTIKLTKGLRNALLDTDSFKSLFADSVLRIFSGTQPSSASSAEAGSILVTITNSGNTPSASSVSASAGLDFSSASSGAIAKSSGQTWKDSSASSGSAAWFRLYDNAFTLGSSSSAIRLDGSCGVGSGDLRMSNTAIAASATVTIDTFTITLPAS